MIFQRIVENVGVLWFSKSWLRKARQDSALQGFAKRCFQPLLLEHPIDGQATTHE